jgi:hypothetical protein
VTTYLLGDSHLAALGASAPALGADVVNLAVGGAVAQDLGCQVHGVALPDAAVLVVSIGTNDADPARGLPLDAFGAVIDAFLAARPGHRWVYVASPGCAGDIDETWTTAGMARYSARAAEAFEAAGGVGRFRRGPPPPDAAGVRRTTSGGAGRARRAGLNPPRKLVPDKHGGTGGSRPTVMPCTARCRSSRPRPRRPAAT